MKLQYTNKIVKSQKWKSHNYKSVKLQNSELKKKLETTKLKKLTKLEITRNKCEILKKIYAELFEN